VISRNVDVGQTVAASMSAPTLYILAADLTKMQVLANIDEADVGRMRPGQHVTFRVDAFPTETFSGTVEQVRLQPTVVQNVVTYSTVIAVPNDQLKLKPGMTANVTIEVARRSNVLRIPAAALRFRPTEEMFQVLNQEVPPELQRGRGGFGNAANGGRGFGGGGGQGRGSGQPQSGQPPSGQAASGQPANTQAAPTGQPSQPAAAPSSAPSTPPAANPDSKTAAQGSGGRPESAEARGGGDRMVGDGGRGGFGGGRGFDPNMTPEERRKRMEERMANMTPEERERFQERMRERMANGGGRGGNQPNAPGQANAAGQGNANAGGAAGGQRNRTDSSRGIAASITPGATHLSGATTIDALFGPLPTVETRGRAWLFIDKKLKPINLRLGVSDGTYTEILNGEIKEGQEVVTNMVTGLEPKTTPGQSNQSNNPLMGPQRGPNRGGGPGGGGGRGR
jgi:hypothetical protein